MRDYDVLYASRQELTPTWSSIEVVITGTTGNRVYPKRVPRVQIPPAPPEKRVIRKDGSFYFVWTKYFEICIIYFREWRYD